MIAKPDGGPAFPRPLPKIKVKPDDAARILGEYSGMSLRDYFAAKVVQGHMASAMVGVPPEILRNDHLTAEALAKFAYIAADAMLAERVKGQA